MRTSARQIAAIALLSWGLWARPAQAQVLVEDAANLVMNTWTSIQQTLGTIEAVLQTGYMVLEIAGIEGLAVDDEFQSDLDSLVALIDDGAAVAWDIQSITQQVTALFHLRQRAGYDESAACPATRDAPHHHGCAQHGDQSPNVDTDSQEYRDAYQTARRSHQWVFGQYASESEHQRSAGQSASGSKPPNSPPRPPFSAP